MILGSQNILDLPVPFSISSSSSSLPLVSTLPPCYLSSLSPPPEPGTTFQSASVPRLQSMAFSTRSRRCGAVLAGADLVWSSAHLMERGADFGSEDYDGAARAMRHPLQSKHCIMH